jgi:hypothetical protein
MSEREPGTESAISLEVLRSLLKGQYHAVLAMLRQAIERCPEDEWLSDAHTNSFWQSAYHILYGTHECIMQKEAEFRPWERHREKYQWFGSVPSTTDEPYTKADLLEFSAICNEMVDGAVDALDLHRADSEWSGVSTLEFQINNIRHIQHHAAQLADRLRAAADVGVDWEAVRHGTG